MRYAARLAVPFILFGTCIAGDGDRTDARADSENHTIAGYQVLCDTKIGFIAKTDCLITKIKHSPNPLLAEQDPETRLFLLVAQDLRELVRKKQLSDSSAQVELQRAYVAMKDRERASSQIDAERMQVQTLQAEWAKADAERKEARRQEAEERQAKALAAAAEAKLAAAQRLSEYNICTGMMTLRHGIASAAVCQVDRFAHLREAAQRTHERPPEPARARGGMLKGQTTSGFNRICYYDGVGGSYAKTIGSTELCPLSD